VDAADLDWITDAVVANVRSEPASPAAVFVLLHVYAQSGAAPVGEALEPLLTEALEAVQRPGDAALRCEWLGIVSQAAAFSDDQRLPAAVERLLPEAIDGLERAAAALYEPGERPEPSARAAHIACANALLTAFDLTGRLPYPMLAEELLQASRHDGWNEAAGMYEGGFAMNGTAATACCRLAQLHRDPDYAARAVLSRAAHYADDAERALGWMQRVHRDHPRDAAEFGRALIHWLALRAHPN